MKEFEETYKDILNNQDEEFKKAFEELKEAKKKIIIIDVIIICIALIYMRINPFNIRYMLIGMVSVIVAYIVAIKVTGIQRKSKRYNSLYKDRVIKKMIEAKFTNLEYEPEMGMSRNIYAEGKYENYDRYKSDDYMIAKIDDKYKVEMAEIETERKETTEDSEGNKRTSYVTIFHGLFAKIEMEKSINSNLEIYPNKTELFFKKNKITMDSSEFEKNFDVKATNKIVAMQLLTSDVMEELISFMRINNMKYDIKIRENIMYIRFYCGRVFETGKLREGIVEKKLIERYYNILNFTYTLPKKIIKLIESTEI